MNRGIPCLVVSLLAVANLVFGHCHAQEPRKSTSVGSNAGQAGAPDVVRLAFLGDLMLGGEVSERLRSQPPEWFWGDTLPILRQADAVIANLEGPITASDERWRKSWKTYHFKADPEAVRILTAGNIRFVNLANNHILDYGERGLFDTLDALDRAGIGHSGAGRSRAEAAASRIFEVHGLKVGVISATDRMKDFAATPDGPGTNYLEIGPASPGPDWPALDWIERSAAELRRAGAALIIFSVHWGPDLRTEPSEDQRRFAHAAIDRGVDVIHGHSAHVVQAIERYRHGVVLYDTGNFIDDYWKVPFRNTNWSFVFILTVTNGEPSRLRLVPVHRHSLPTQLATGDVFRAMTDDMRSRSAAFGTTIVETAEGLKIPFR